jgi:ABC-type uncharacterized transport system substrate-binding protein
MMPMMRPLFALAVAALAASLAPLRPGDALAHPHVWITFEATVLYDKGRFTGLQHKWTFDEYYTAMAIEGLDKNKDGVYDREELAELAKVNIDGLKEFGYFTYPVLAGHDVKLKEPKDYWLEHKGGALSLHFVVEFVEPVPATAKDFAFVVQDPVFFIAFLPAKVDPIKFAEGAPKSCKATIGNPKREGEEDSDRLAKAFSQLATPVSVAKAVSVDCAGP